MSDEQPEGVGSVAEEAVKLLGALQGWVQDPSSGSGRRAAADAAGGAAGWLREVNEHVATGGDDCRWCPVCQVIHAVRETSPEVKDHLATAATSLLHAAAGILEATTSRGTQRDPGPDRGDPVEKIDLDDDTEWETE